MPSNSGANDAAVGTLFDSIISGGATVRLLTTDPSKSDTSADLSTYEVNKGGYSAVTVPEADWNVTKDGSFSTADTLSNANELNFGTATEDWGLVTATVIDSGNGQFLLDNDDVGQVPKGIEVTISAGGLTYEHGP